MRGELPGADATFVLHSVYPFASLSSSLEFAPAEQEGASHAGGLATPGLLPVLLLRALQGLILLFA